MDSTVLTLNNKISFAISQPKYFTKKKKIQQNNLPFSYTFIYIHYPIHSTFHLVFLAYTTNFGWFNNII